MGDKCPNCDIELSYAKFSDLETQDDFCWDVIIIYCPECGYLHDCYAK